MILFYVFLLQTLESDFFPIQDGFFGDRGFQGMMGLRNEDAGIAAQARSVLAWHDKLLL